MKKAPNSIRVDEAIRVLEYCGYLFVRQRGSHMVFKNSNKREIITIPKRNPIKAVYVEEILERIVYRNEDK
jgi:predicted RNA binding protein YcfA (HicA-like mRNA interferase family)